jgi:hypothetical protein
MQFEEGKPLESKRGGSKLSFLLKASGTFLPWEGKPLGSEKKADKIDFLYRASNAYLVGGTWLDMTTTYPVLHHPTVAYRADGSVLTRYYGIETGWAGCLGRRNTVAVIAANVALNAGLNLLSRRIYRRGGRWRVLAITVNVLKGTDNLMAGVHNIRYNAGVDGRVQLATGYMGQIRWSR